MELAITKNDGSVSGSVELNDAITGADFNQGLVHQLVVAYLANARVDTVGHRSRSDVVGTGRKPWSQKGQGRARAGTVKSPLWRGGGKTFVAENRHHQQKVNRKMHRAGMRSIVAELIRQERLVVVESLKPETPKTAAMATRLAALGGSGGRTLLVEQEFDANLNLAVRNIPDVESCIVSELSPVDLVGAEKVLISTAALAALEEKLQ
ncbi:MAG: 50S ribosomal protein L4 [Gammaproteobacteria bacterium]